MVQCVQRFWLDALGHFVTQRFTVLLKKYDKCPEISYTKVSDKMAYANSADPDQTAPEGAVWSGSSLFTIPISISRTNQIKSKI